MDISVVIPAYNEEKRIEPALKKIIKYIKKKFRRYEIIVVDDCSTDNTSKIASKYKEIRVLKNKSNQGKGYSVKRGVLASKYPLILFSDSDLAAPIEELQKLIQYKEYDVVFGSRNLKESDVQTKQPLYRQIMGKMFPLLVNLIVLRNTKDTQCGFKLFKKKAAEKIFPLQTINGFAFDVEILYIAKKLGFKIKEVPVVWIDQEGSKVNPVKDGIKMLKSLLQIRINNLKGRYSK